MSPSGKTLTSIEICAGAGGQAVGLHAAGFRHLALVEIDANAVETLKLNLANRDGWEDEQKNCKVLSMDVKDFKPFKELDGLEPGKLDLLAGGVPCPPFSIAGRQLGEDDERDLFPTMLGLVEELKPRAVMIENVRGLLEPDHKFKGYREQIVQRLRKAGYYYCGWKVLEARDFGVPQLRPRAILVMIHKDHFRGFDWPKPDDEPTTVAQALDKSMRSRYSAYKRTLKTEDERQLAEAALKRWRERAASGGIAPTLVGGSKKHGGADLGPTRAKRAWGELGVDGLGVANDPEKMVAPERDLLSERGPMLTVTQAAIIQGFPENWEFYGGKTARYRQVGNAFPPPVAEAVGRSIAEALGRTGPLSPNPEAEVNDGSLLTRGLVPTQEAGSAHRDSVGNEECAPVG
ncbi:DNA cytosine methyltransferase [Kitasatospora sp. McL0602]|uniref:DNA cytosine methyltransferase n=1 Tax=Kitasatospora sp. McL0602 TaxID=3439530 RepID=UPI003F8C4CDF